MSNFYCNQRRLGNPIYRTTMHNIEYNQSLLDPSSEISLPLPLLALSLLSLLVSLSAFFIFMERSAFSRNFLSRASVSIFSSSDEDCS